jgi:hypothetical protein
MRGTRIGVGTWYDFERGDLVVFNDRSYVVLRARPGEIWVRRTFMQWVGDVEARIRRIFGGRR